LSNQGIESFIRPGIATAAPYDAKHHDFAWQHPELDRLMSNECPLPPTPSVLAAAHEALSQTNLYPNSGQDLREALAEFCDVRIDNVILGNGSTEVLDVATRALIGPGDEAVISVPTYAFFETQTRLHGGTPILVPMLDDFQFDVEGILAAITPRTKAIFLCSPNNPTGNSWLPPQLERVLAAGIPTIVDQAYLECGQSPSFAPMVLRHRNLLVTRTMSKAFGLAALRLGYMIGDPPIIDALHRLRIPFSISLIALRAGLAAVRNLDELETRTAFISAERRRLFHALLEMRNVHPFESEGNFILVDIRRTGRTAGEIVELVRAENVLVRAMTAHGLRDAYVRVTIGLPEQNDRFLAVFRRAISTTGVVAGSGPASP
jgi:histidinol-phosphate aminotransferase